MIIYQVLFSQSKYKSFLLQLLTACKIKEFLEQEGYDVRINEPWTGAIMDVVKDANDKDLVGIGFEFRQDLLQNKEWMDKLCVDVAKAFNSLALE